MGYFGNKMKDFIGDDVYIGDYVYYTTYPPGAENRIGKVVRFTEKTMFVVIVKSDRIIDKTYENRQIAVRSTFVKVHYKEKE